MHQNRVKSLAVDNTSYTTDGPDYPNNNCMSDLNKNYMTAQVSLWLVRTRKKSGGGGKKD